MVSFLLADSHCHLDWFKNPEKEVEKAKLAGVMAILSNSTDFKSIEANLRLAKDFEMVKCAIGIHPVDLLQIPVSDLSLLSDFVEKNVGGAVAIGEVGMDFKRAVSFEQRSLQEFFFRKFVELAVKKNLPVVVHARYCETECLDILEEMGVKKVHMHWFTNSKKTSARAVSLGYKISCGPIILSDNKSADVVKEIPIESLMLETDAPVEFGGCKSTPSWIRHVCLKVAELKNIPPEEVSRVTGKNFANFYGK